MWGVGVRLGGLLAVVGLLLAGSVPVGVPPVEPGRPTRATPATPRAASFPLGVTIFPSGGRRPLPALQGRTLGGGRLALSSLRGRVVVLNIWASWCEPCQAESPALVAVSRSAAGARVRFVGINENDRSSDATAFLRSVDSSYPNLVDDGVLIAQLSEWLPSAVPGSLIVDPRGRVAARVVGPVTAGQLRLLLSDLSTT